MIEYTFPKTKVPTGYEEFAEAIDWKDIRRIQDSGKDEELHQASVEERKRKSIRKKKKRKRKGEDGR